METVAVHGLVSLCCVRADTLAHNFNPSPTHRGFAIFRGWQKKRSRETKSSFKYEAQLLLDGERFPSDAT